ncbi:MAG TPA: hypothetical protein VHW71_07555 [Steroidobacteraceae bacterium]|jgi:hypothetical protein|nr:hypothetical protein [Steroidobacteraceae bacterium]
MSVRTLADGAVRMVAALSTLAFSLIVILGSVFASDSGTPASTLTALAVLGAGGAISLWVLL